MPRFDLELSALREYAPDVRCPADFDDFWDATLREARAQPAVLTAVSVDLPLPGLEVSDVQFPGFAGEPIRGWLIKPRGVSKDIPVIVEFLGYGAGRGLAFERLLWASAGYAHLVMDTRGQGAASGTGGVTADNHGSGPALPGFLTKGIDAPDTYYYRRLIADGVRAVDAVREQPWADANRISVMGSSQGGGVALAVAALSRAVHAVLADVPFLCHFERAVGFTDKGPYAEIATYLSVHRGAEERVFETLSYFDGVNFAARIEVAALVSVALMDPICPPSTVFAAFNRIPSQKEIAVYPWNQHEGGQAYQWMTQWDFISGLGAPGAGGPARAE